MTGKVMLVVDWRPQFFSTWASPQGCLGILEAWKLVSSRRSNLRGLQGSYNAFNDQLSKSSTITPAALTWSSQKRRSHLLTEEGQHHVVKENEMGWPLYV